MKLRVATDPKNALYSIAAYAILAGASALFSVNLGAQTSPAGRVQEGVTLNFSNAEIEAVARTMATITGANVVVDPRVKGLITLVTDRPVSRRVAMNQFQAALRLQGFTMVESAGLYKVVPEADAKLQSGAVTVSDEPVGGALGNQITTQIFKLNFESANNLVAVLRPLISPNNTINVNPGTNSLIITDYADNLRRMARIIAAVDVSNATDVQILPLKHAIATDLAPLVLRLVESSGAGVAPGQADTSFKTILMAEPRSNALILRAANPARVALVRSLVDKLDQPPAASTNGDAGNIYVVYLKNADATKLAATLRAAMSGQAPAAAAPAGVAGAVVAAVAVSATGGQIQADVATNSLIISAPEPQYRQLRAVIDRLDGRRAQVLVESLIVEVNADRAAEFGIQWQGPLGKAGDGVIGLLGTNFGAAGKNIINLATGAGAGTVAPAPGINFGAVQRTNGIYVLGFLANFLESSGSGNVLSTPNLLTLDNEEAKIVIGENVPFITGQFTNTGSGGGSGGSVNPFTTVERKDVGLTLKVKPQINENGTVKLVIYQETSAVKAGTETAVNGPTTSKRTIESTVLVDDGSIVVLGGLLQDKYSGNEQKVPGLGDVPVFGNLFKNDSRTRNKTNLMVFLRPVVVRDAQDSDNLSLDRYELMRSGMNAAQPKPSRLAPINEAPVLPALPGSVPAIQRPAPPEPLGATPAVKPQF
ncbi:MAG: type II secretion system secretin GspD [Gammaproteobacteria bacterium]|uniref:type II secretion system secretin GspD n=1 Tax=Rhodoferax sp. TaxID=50421 RepID=UPI0017C5606D|nr:type II secretion system secretin GspD [Rhodoferax sp.]MBU3900470.1 type II secretion system secretin GspD [Gammaproteobacteria bacterium]MBA3059937.1 type II secretion system protein GspD [Rhodoferax sp.]MBU3997126.1 type II secretion system secretin GspD [Gammaproteobacteria bacterium]MBU4079915.1 type II secretion system secretin GspD [Gammaproteobacteria bacterium]MBU4112930.1 type II secretion system secretin GspD [Gammaproteobacteria bacterium]